MITQLLRRVEGISTRQYKGIVRAAKKYRKVFGKKVQRFNRKYIGKWVANSLAIKMIGYVVLFVAISSGMKPAMGDNEVWASSLKFDKTKAMPVVMSQKQLNINVVPIIPPAPPAPAPKPVVRAPIARERAVIKPVPKPVVTPVYTGDIKAYAKARSDAMFGPGHWSALESLWMRESGWNYRALNKSSGACGIPQALPCSKGGVGFRTNPEMQIEWGLRYIKGRYGTPSKAWSFWLSRHWY